MSQSKAETSDFKSNESILNKYLDRIEKKSPHTANNQEIIIRECLNFINKPIYEIKRSDIINFITKKINCKIAKKGKNKGNEISLESKKTYCHYLKSFFDDLEYRTDEKINYRSPVPSLKFIKLTGVNKRMEKVSKREKTSFSTEEIKEILRLTKGKSFRDFILYSIIITTGMRISECLTIKIENIHLEERYIETGLEHGAMKSKQALIFFFPKNFKIYLQKYILWTKREKRWLFKGYTENHLIDGGLRQE